MGAANRRLTGDARKRVALLIETSRGYGRVLLRGIAVALRTAGVFMRYLGDALINLYDLIIFGPLWLESLVKPHGHRRPAGRATS